MNKIKFEHNELRVSLMYTENTVVNSQLLHSFKIILH
jgi:hypothetical protein